MDHSGKTRIGEAQVSYRAKLAPGLMAWRRARGLNRPLFATLSNCSERKLATYEKEKAEDLPPQVNRQITEAQRLVQALEDLMPDESLREWLETENPAFEGRPPMEVIGNGESDRIWEMIHQARLGTFA